MAIKNLQQISCSLNLGLIYSVNYSWEPQQGVSISVYFVNESGNYQRPEYLQKAYIRLGSASFSMYVVSSKISLASGRRVMEVRFVDEFFQLNNYYIALTGKGCGFNVYNLGTPVDDRTNAQKQADALDPIAQQIAEFTQFQDVEYKFNEFLTTLRKKFNVQLSASVDNSLTNTFTGSFKEVLNSWCSYYNLSFFFENGIIKIFDPTRLNIVLPPQPSDAIEFESEEDITDTYGKTVCNWFQQEGGQFSLNQTSNENGTLLVRTNTLYPIGYEFNLPQNNLNLYQVAAAMYGQNFWFLYNYYKGTTAANCSWTPINPSSNFSVVQNALNRGFRIAAVDTNAGQAQFEAFQQYGTNVAGRYYLSNKLLDLSVDQTYTWFDETEGQITSFTNVDDKTVNLDYLTPPNNETNIVDGTIINQYYSGINYYGNRILFKDNFASPQNAFVLTPTQQALVNSTYQNLYKIDGVESIDFNSDLAPVYGTLNTYLAYQPLTTPAMPQELIALFDGLAVTGLLPRYTEIPLKGIRTTDYSSLKSSQNEPDNVVIVKGNEGGTIVSNTSVIKTLKNGAYTVYYDKYSQCGSAHSTGPYFQHRFEPRQISTDIAISFNFLKNANNTYTLKRDFGTLNRLVNNPLLPTLAQARSFLTKRVSFSINYFRDVPVNFLSNGLVGMSISVAGDGVTCTYTFSNEVVQVPYPENQFNKFEQQVRNSWIRQYQPNSTIT